MLLPSIAVIVGLIILVWSADRFIDGSASLARSLGMSPLLIGIIIIGFGTSAPEMIVSAISSLNGNPAVALGNAYGSNITNIALILGLTAVIKPIIVNSQILKKELPVLAVVTLISAYFIYDAQVSHLEAWLLIAIFVLYMSWTIWQATQHTQDNLAQDVVAELEDHPPMPLKNALLWMLVGVIALMGSSQLLVWGAVEIAQFFGVSDLIIGLTIVAVGTSLPELAASIMAAKKGEVDLAVGNIIGSNLFNTLAVVGIAGVISPISVEPEVFTRDMSFMTVLTFSLFIFGCHFGKKIGIISRLDGSILLLGYFGYNAYLIYSVLV